MTDESAGTVADNPIYFLKWLVATSKLKCFTTMEVTLIT